MDIQKAIVELKNSMEEPFEDRCKVFVKNKNQLQKEIDKNPGNVDAWCLLVIVLLELRYSDEACMAVLDKCYRANKGQLKDRDYALWATNKAYFLLEELYGEEHKKEGIGLLKEAVEKNSPFAETYYGLGKVYYFEGQLEEALLHFEKAYDLSGDRAYGYCQATSLLALGRTAEGLELLRDLHEPDQTVSTDVDISILMTLVRECAALDYVEEAEMLLDELEEVEEIYPDQMAEIYFLLEHYEDCIRCYEMEHMWAEAYWLSIYFYALKQLDEQTKGDLQVYYIINQIQEGMIELQCDPMLEEDSIEEQARYVVSEMNRLSEITQIHNEVFEKDFCPEVEIGYDLVYECYYVNCPRR